jgi:hypothetical protein
MSKLFLHLTVLQWVLALLAIGQIVVATADGLKLIRLPDLPDWLSSPCLGLLMFLTGILAVKLKSISIWGIELIVIRGFLVASSSLYPELSAVADFLNNDYIRIIWYEFSAIMILFDLSKILVIEEHYEEILKKSKVSLTDLTVIFEKFHRDNPDQVVYLPPGTKFVVVNNNPTTTSTTEVVAKGTSHE